MGHNMSGINQVQLNAAHGATVGVGFQDGGPELRAANVLITGYGDPFSLDTTQSDCPLSGPSSCVFSGNAPKTKFTDFVDCLGIFYIEPREFRPKRQNVLLVGVHVGGPKWIVGGTVFEMWLGAL